MYFSAQIAKAKYRIIDFDKINPSKDPFVAKWDGFYHGDDRLADPENDVEFSGFFSVPRKRKGKNRIKVYLDDGDGIFSKKDDTLLSSYKLAGGTWWSERGLLATNRKGELSIDYTEEAYTYGKGKSDRYRLFDLGVTNFNARLNLEIDPDLGDELFAEHLTPYCVGVDI